ncbi:NAD-dependent dihydropyrimidine dehydrogenase, PreA subunit [Verrucomicrobium sp. GAS474]|uniref:4Fe-4S dicluster domain-containing protein n=1 Tax=Verrucomicrobium sp. GAS474 TaxID=1882831 RepID=UPI00087B0F62|nr:ferredoxin family protein [Verrucomicrobium sp. GAS474]SDT85826.1 NAD-dependent dihydropyrimidine dehydrogenase, PreA subunit [Verrucomicrobium sp. GAS474]
MIELVSQDRCISCDICVSVCPTDVFEAVPDGPPVVARKEDCQTCFLCEAHCPADALYVAPEAHIDVAVNEAELIATNRLGSYRRSLGWGKGNKNTATLMAELNDLRTKLESPF